MAPVSVLSPLKIAPALCGYCRSIALVSMALCGKLCLVLFIFPVRQSAVYALNNVAPPFLFMMDLLDDSPPNELVAMVLGSGAWNAPLYYDSV